VAQLTRFVLGSASAGRLRVLRQAGVEPLVVVSGVDEDAIVASLGPDAAPGDVVRSLAEAKADHVATIVDAAVAADCVVIGCDSMLYISGQLHTGHCVVRLRDGQVSQRAAESFVTTVHFGTPTAADLDAYLDSDEPLAVAGAFTLDGLGGWFVDSIEGDPSNVIGLSLPQTRALLERVGVSVAELWMANPA